MENFTLGLILAPVWSNHLGKTQQTVAIEEMENYDFDLKGANLKIPKKTTDNVIKSNKCNQCDYASYHAGHLRTHLKTHSGEKSNKCNQVTMPLRIQAIWGNIWKRTVEKSQRKAANANMHPHKQAIWGHTCYKKNPEKYRYLFSKIPVSVFELNPGIPVFSGIPQGPAPS